MGSVMKFSVSPVVRVAVEPKTAGDLPKLVQGLNRLAKSDPMVQIIHMKTGEHIVAGAGELHLEICLKDLQEDFMNNTPVRISPPVVSYRETVTETGPQCLSKSANKHNRIFLHAEPLDDDLINFIMEDKFRMNLNEKDRTEFMRENFDWDRKETKTIWALGPDGHGPNMIKNETSGVQYLLEIKESVVQGFNWATGCGPLAEEEMQGVRFNLEDVTMHADSIHRGMGQIFPPTRRCMYAALMMSAPSLLEPMYLAEITAPMSVSVVSTQHFPRDAASPRVNTRDRALPLPSSRPSCPSLSLSDSPLRCARTPADRPSLSVCLITGKW